jgi:protease IV
VVERNGSRRSGARAGLLRRGGAGLGLWLALFALPACHGRPRLEPAARPLSVLDDRPKNVVFDLSHDAPESTAGGGLLPLPAQRTYAGLVGLLEKARQQPAPGYFVRFGEHSFDWARTQELGQLLGELRATGRPVVCHANAFTNASMWLALAGCDQIWLSPAGTVDTVGIGAEAVYLKRLLDRFKVKAEFLHVGRYKSAAETMTRDSASEDAKESLEAVLASIRQSWLDGVAKLNKDPAVVGALEAGPWVPNAARAVGLITHIGYESEARTALTEQTHESGFEPAAGAADQESAALEAGEVLRALSGAADSIGSPHIAILPASGGISMGGGGMSQDGITDQGLARQIRALRKDQSVKAVVLRIDSPGGSALASDLLWRELMDLRRDKPVIASVGNMAASGGYYLACAAERIVAEPTSIVGSIGVVGGKIVIGEALDEFGVSTQFFSAKPGEFAQKRAAYMSSVSGWDDATRERVQEQMQAVYDLFISRVAEGRKLDPAKVREVAEGRIWSGAQGLERGLVDEFGGLSRAVVIAKELAKLPSDAPVTVEGPTGGLLELLGLGENADESSVRSALAQLQAAQPAASQVALAAWARAGMAESALAMAASKGVSTQLQSLAPLLGGERVLAVMPFTFETK